MFSYKDLTEEIQRFCNYGFETGTVGESELGRRIPYVFVGKKNGNYMIVQGAMHAREHLTALVVVCLAKELVSNKSLKLDGGIYFVPMTNPDGVELCQQGVKIIDNKELKSNLIAMNKGTDFTLWKANGKGVDLNVNFDAKWASGTLNEFCKSSANYVGKCPFSERESRCLAEFTQRIKPCVTLSYHLKGEQIYWDFGQQGYDRQRDKLLAELIAKRTGYTIVDGKGSVGGYKDWCVEKLNIPSFTIEVGSDNYEHPFPYEQLSVIMQQNKDIPRRLLNSVVRYNSEKKLPTENP